MATPQTGAVKFEERREQAKHALLTSLASAHQNPEGKEVVQHLTHLLGELEGIAGPNKPGKNPLTDQDGLPIVEITEDVHDYDVPRPPRSAKINEYPTVRKFTKAERDRLLDLLEEEEREWEKQQSGASATPQAADTTPPATEQTQKESVPQTDISTQKTVPVPASERPSSGGKSVSFADGINPEKDTGVKTSDKEDEWGDLVPGMLTGRKKLQTSTRVMKPQVVEKYLAPEAGSSYPIQPKNAIPADSDDEDDVDFLSEEPTTSEKKPWQPESEDDDVDGGAIDEGFEEGEDMDVASLQRQVAFDYYAKRETILQGPEAQALKNKHQIAESQDPWDQKWVPLDASLASHPEKDAPPESRFKNARNPPHSVKVSALGASMNTTVKEGKLVNRQLVAPTDTDSDDDELGEHGKRIIEKLRSRSEDSETAPTPSEQSKESLKPKPTSIGDIIERKGGSSAPIVKPVTNNNLPPSRFKATRTAHASKIPLTENRPSEVNRAVSAAIPPNVALSPSFPPSTQLPGSPRATGSFDPYSVVREDVKERAPSSSTPQPSSNPQKVSRFKAQRM